MAYSIYTPSILTWKGYVPEDDFIVNVDQGVVTSLDWFHSDPKPTETDIEALEKPWAAYTKRKETKLWASLTNTRTYELAGVNGDFDNFVADVRKAVRRLVNNYAAEEGLTARVSGNESKTAFEDAVPKFDLLAETNLARREMRNQINALRDDPQATAQDILDYVVDDAKAIAVHAAAYPSESPTLEELLNQFPFPEE